MGKMALHLLHKHKIGYYNKINQKKMLSIRITYNYIYMRISTKYLLQLLKFYEFLSKRC